ncbi:MAG: hypothetical protein ACFFAU_11695, partial [Candidatus Hodarchaeota archaeon]
MKITNAYRKKYWVTILIGLSISFAFIQPVSSSIEASRLRIALNPVIIQLDKDKTVSYVVNELKTSIESARIENPNSKEELLKIERQSHGEIFIIGHGYHNGIQFDSTIIEWSELESLIDQSPSYKHYILSCYSSQIGGHNKIIRTFDKMVDADIALVVTKTTRKLIEIQLNELAAYERTLEKSIELKNHQNQIV